MDDRKATLRQILLRRGSSLASELLAIQRHVEPVEKAHKWASNPRCLLHRRTSPNSFRPLHNRNLSRKFVAVSWTWEPSKYEDRESGKYSMISPASGREEKLDIRNAVLDRIVKYLEHVDIHIFWIDRICIDQDNPARKAKALDSMDLIYRNATKTIGLLTTPIRTRKGLRLLKLLFSGQLCHQQEDSCYAFRGGTDYRDIVMIIQILYDLAKDPWWTRAWIFQEEYISGLRMDLLIPLACNEGHSVEFLSIPRELCVGACELREQTTAFILAYKNTNWKRYRSSCDEILNVMGKYNVLFPTASDIHLSMSASILADIGRRGIKEPWDALAITANSCGYAKRLDRISLMKEDKSLSLCLLAMFLLNGEIITTGRLPVNGSNDPLAVNVATFLKHALLRKTSHDSSPRQLSFFKNCRLPMVRLFSRGVQAYGLVWELQHKHKIHTRLLSRSHQQYTGFPPNPWEEESLTQLAHRLRRRHQFLASKLLTYIDNRRSGVVSFASVYMDRMASKLVQAISRGYALRVGYLKGGGAGAIFVPRYEDLCKSTYAFTAWGIGDSDVTSLDNFVSLKVTVRQDGSLNVVEWIDGLAFFHGIEAEPMMLNWPRSWNALN